MIEAVPELSVPKGPVPKGRVPQGSPPRPEPAAEPAACRAVDLHSLLAAVLLTRAQAATLVTDAADQLELGRGRFARGASATVSGDGHLILAAVAGEDGPARGERAAVDAVVPLLRAVARACHDRAYSARLDESMSEATDSAELGRRVRAAVAPDLAPTAEDRVRRQLGLLVAATRAPDTHHHGGDGGPSHDSVGPSHDSVGPSHDSVGPSRGSVGPSRGSVGPSRGSVGPSRGSVGPSRGSGGSSLAPDGWLAPVANPWHRRTRRPSKRQGALAVIAVLLLAGAAWKAPAALTQLRLGWDTLLASEEQPEQDRIRPVSPPAAPDPAPGAVPAPPVDTGLPGSAGPVTEVTATLANGNCVAGQACVLRVDVHVDARANVDAVTWKLVAYDRCTGAAAPGPEITMPVPAGAQEVYGIGSVAVPAGTATGVAAVTGSPAAAASDPVYVPADNATCPGEGRDAGR
ncbi:hypothetical protein ACFWPA_04550 [Rhodococcus sp. NPDC058505]|uniref:hypothetical protein n=1 Tax=Rhodococcus sp. NPDC058505 TaxID=3346531 RepID=UPI003649C6BF